MEEKIIRYMGGKDMEKMSIEEFNSLKKKIVFCSLVYYGLYLDGVWFKTEGDSSPYLAAPISEDQLKRIIPIQEMKYYVSDPESVEHFKNIGIPLAEQRCFRRVDPVDR